MLVVFGEILNGPNARGEVGRQAYGGTFFPILYY